MLNMRLSEVALWTQGRLHGDDGIITGVGIDSRHLHDGDLFVALPGSRSDGHEHLADAATHGARAALVSRRVDAPLAQIEVANTQTALGDLASAVRARRNARVIGITGSNGKTTVKTLTASILSRHARTHVNQGNRNNEIGLPLSVLAMPVNSQYAVFEMGAGKPGDIEYLAAIARPHVGLVNNVAPAHLERMKTLEGIAETKGAVYAALPADGTAIINADDRFAEYFASVAGNRAVLRFGMNSEADVHASDVETTATGSHFTLHTPSGTVAVDLPLPGRHNIANALAAAAIASAVGIPLQIIAAGLKSAEAIPGRLQVEPMAGDWHLIDDSYNANPASLQAAIDTLTALPGEAWLVLGDMGELGSTAPAQHADAGAMARRQGVTRLWTTGELSAEACKAFGEGGRHFDDAEALAEALSRELHSGVNCLIKGSRAAAMERVVTALRALDHKGDSHAA